MLRATKTITIEHYDLGIKYVSKWIVEGKPLYSFYPYDSSKATFSEDRSKHDLKILNESTNVLFEFEDFKHVQS